MKKKRIKTRILSLLSTIVLLCGVMVSSGVPEVVAEVIVRETNLAVDVDINQNPSAFCKNADGTDLYYYNGRKVSNSGSLSYDSVKKLSMMSHNGESVYCIGEYFHKNPDGSATGTLSENIPTNAEYQRYISSAVAGMNFRYALSEADKYYVTQCAVRALYYNIPASALGFFNPNGSPNPYMNEEFQRIMNASNTPVVNPVTTISIKGNDNKTIVSIGGKQYYRFGAYSANVQNGSIADYRVSLSNPQAFHNRSANPSSATSTARYNSTGSFYVFAPVNSNGDCKIELVTTTTSNMQYQPSVFITMGDDSSPSKSQNVLWVESRRTNQQQSTNRLIAWNMATGNLRVNKYILDTAGNFLTRTEDTEEFNKIKDARFVIKNADTGEYLTATGLYTYTGTVASRANATEFKVGISNVDYQAFEIVGVPVGNYEIIESTGITGYKIASSANTTVTADSTSVVEIENQQNEVNLSVAKDFYTSLGYQNTNIRRDLIEQVRFTVQNDKGEYINAELSIPEQNWYSYTGTSATPIEYGLSADTLGFTLFYLPSGTYTITETQTADGHSLAPSRTVTIVQNTGTVNFVNEPTTSIVSLQKRTEGMLNLNGIGFTLSGTSITGEVVNRTSTTNANGIATFEDIPIGVYEITEDGNTVPSVYLVADPQEVDVRYGENPSVEFLNIEKTGSIQVEKRTEGMLNLDGIGFTLSGTSDSGRAISMTSLTGIDGIAMFESIPVGTYTITEDGSTVPTAYLVADAQQVTVSYSETSSVEFFNEEKTGSIQLQKRTEDMRNIDGITFVLSGTSDSGRAINLTAITDGNGKATFENIPIGTYSITEDGSTIPVGYLVATAQEVTVNYAETSNVEFLNSEQTGNIQISKRTEGMLNLEGIGFTLSGTADNGKEISMTSLTNSNGIATFANIPIGTYSITENENTVPTAYLVADGQQVTVNHAQTSNVEFFNEEQTGSIQVAKNTVDMRNIEGIAFILSGISDSGREINQTAITDEKGIAVFENIPIGTYIITEDESTVPIGYLVADEVGITVSYAQTSNITFVNEEQTGSIQIQKRTEDMTNIKGISFILSGTSDNGKEINLNATTDENGIATFENILVGTYTITEDKSTVPTGYLVAKEQEVTVSYAETSNIEFKNEKIPETPDEPTPPKTSNYINNTLVLIGLITLIIVCGNIFSRFKRRKKKSI